jgi:hypothetical protein
MKNHLNNTQDPPSQTFYKSVLIVGKDLYISQEIHDLYKKQGYLLIGDGKKSLSELDLTLLNGKINDMAIINIDAHGLTYRGTHTIDDLKTKKFFQK